MERKIYKYILENNMIKSGDTVVVGLSGGADSVCLFTILEKLRKKLSFDIVGVHVNHGLRGDSADRDERFARYICDKFKVPIEIFNIDVRDIANQRHLTCEEAGRIARYEAFDQILTKYNADKIAVAHHMNDQAETVLFNLFRGTGLAGLAGIKPVNNKIIRPLLCVNRQEIEHYLSDNKLLFMTDETNKTDEFMRNRIRNHILPYAVMNINENSIANINQSAGICFEALAYISKVATEYYKKLSIEDGDSVLIRRDGFVELPEIIKQHVVMKAIEYIFGGLKDISYNNIKDVVTLFDLAVSKKRNLPNGIFARKEYEGVRIVRKEEEISFVMPEYDMKICDWDHSEILKNDYTKYFDYDKIKTHLVMRTRKAGDYLVVDSNGSKKKLKDYFINEKVPANMRDSIPLLADGEHIVWIVGMRISEEYKVTNDTKRVIIVTVNL